MKDATIADVLPLAPLQEGLWYHSSYDQSGPDVYVGQWVFQLDGELDEARLRQAIADLLRRNASLRGSFVQRRSGELVQVIMREVPPPLRVLELGDRTLAELRDEERALRFDLSKAPLLRFLLVRSGGERNALIMTVHHIITDGWSASLLLDELFELYRAGAQELPPRRPYRDYLAWLAQQDPAEAEAAWRDALADVTSPLLVAPGDSGRDAGLAEFVERDLTPELGAELAALAGRHSVTLNIVLQAAWAIVLAQHTGGTDILFGVTVSGRPPELDNVEEMIGLFINTVPVRVSVTANTTLAELLRAIQLEQARLMNYPHVKLSTIQQAAGVGRLFDTTFVFQNQPGGDDARTLGPGLTATLSDARDYNSFALSLQVSPGEVVRLELGYQPNLLEGGDVAAIADQLEHVLRCLAEDPAARIGELAGIPAEVHERMVRTWNDTRRGDVDTTLVELFQAQVERQPDAVAITTASESVTYSELNSRANRLAHLLIAHGEGPDRPVALMLPRSVELVVAMLATLKAGAGYVAMDPEDPTERLVVMLNDAAPTTMLAMEDLALRFAGVDIAHLPLSERRTAEELARRSPANPSDADRTAVLDPEEIAYIAYTSGSTGTPKGIVITHSNVASLVLDERWRSKRSRRVFAHSPQAFDATTYEVWVPLSTGGEIVLSAPGRFDKDDAARILREVGATSTYLTARLFNTLVEEAPECLAGLAEIWTGAEAASPEVFRAALDRLPGVDLINVYGPTEATVFATRHVVRRPGDIGASAVPVGTPLDNTRVYVLDARMRPVPPGGLGEIYLGGPRIARGYLGRSRLTSERFVCDPFADVPGARMYRTGDLGRWHADGRLEFAGRSDQQAKIRGFRIEPAEVEAAFLREPQIAAAAVVVRTDRAGEKSLAGYVVQRAGHRIDESELRAGLAKSLPHYMVPADIVVLDRLPLTGNGKLDRDALPDPERSSSPTGRRPRTHVEKVLCEVFGDVLAVEQVSIDDDFFAMGGESLTAIRVVNRLRRTLNTEVAIQQLFALPQIAELAKAIEHAATPARPALRRRSQPDEQSA